MSWSCEKCGEVNEDGFATCACGYEVPGRPQRHSKTETNDVIPESSGINLQNDGAAALKNTEIIGSEEKNNSKSILIYAFLSISLLTLIAQVIYKFGDSGWVRIMSASEGAIYDKANGYSGCLALIFVVCFSIAATLIAQKLKSKAVGITLAAVSPQIFLFAFSASHSMGAIPLKAFLRFEVFRGINGYGSAFARFLFDQGGIGPWDLVKLVDLGNPSAILASFLSGLFVFVLSSFIKD